VHTVPEIPIVFCDNPDIPDDRPGAGDVPGEWFFQVRDRIVEVCQRHGPTGPEDEPWTADHLYYWVVNDQYNDERYQQVELEQAKGVTRAWVLDLMATLRDLPHWGVILLGGGVYLFGDYVIAHRPWHDGCKDLDAILENIPRILNDQEGLSRR
jgi:hypothetical protein